MAIRASDTLGSAATRPPGPGGDRSATADGLSCVLVIQVPLLVPDVVPMPASAPMEAADEKCLAAPAMCKRERGMEQAVVSAGPVEGPWVGLHGCRIQRDLRFPIRVMVQFYQTTDTAELTSPDLDRLARTIHRG